MAVELIKDRFALLTLLFGHEDTASNKVCSMIKLSKKHHYSSGFRPNHSCETALLQTINKFHEAINNGQIIGMVMVDFRKAFDLVDHTLLLKKLRHNKISDETLLWFSSYLLNRKQKVVINNIESTTENIVCGVPQGTILGLCYF